MNIQKLKPFHLAFPVRNLQETEIWYTNILGCTTQKSDTWINFNFFGHQMVLHFSSDIDCIQTNEVDNDEVSTRYFALILSPIEWNSLAINLKSKKINFGIQPHTRFKDNVGEQYTTFIEEDSNGNFLEFKALNSDCDIFLK